MDSAHKTSDFQIGIIGAGFGGIIAALHLMRNGRNDFVIFERANAIGGTWRENTYPGCACDVPSYVYSIAEVPNPDWSRMYSTQPEILAYMQQVVKVHDIESHIRYDSEVVEAEFVEPLGIWKVTDDKGRTTTVHVLIGALGPLNRPKLPAIDGIDRFKGKAFHTAQWDNSYDLTGKKVAVIGTGASSIQVVPAIAPAVAELTVFQRTAAWISPRNDKKVSKARMWRFRHFPFLQKIFRAVIFNVMEFRGKLFMGNKFVHRIATKQCLKKLNKEVLDLEIRRKLTPDYKLGCKRILSSDDYLPSFNRPNVHLVTDSITEIKENSILTADGKEHPMDAIVFATGFDAAEFQTDWKIKGLNGRDLFFEWDVNGMQAHKGTVCRGYPNLLFILGPNTGLGHNSVLLMMEAQMPYILQYLDCLDRQGENAYLDVRNGNQMVYQVTLKYLFIGTVWESGCHSWYKNSHGKNTTLYPRLVRNFRKELARFDVEAYDAFSSSNLIGFPQNKRMPKCLAAPGQF